MTDKPNAWDPPAHDPSHTRDVLTSLLVQAEHQVDAQHGWDDRYRLFAVYPDPEPHLRLLHESDTAITSTLRWYPFPTAAVGGVVVCEVLDFDGDLSHPEYAPLIEQFTAVGIPPQAHRETLRQAVAQMISQGVDPDDLPGANYGRSAFGVLRGVAHTFMRFRDSGAAHELRHPRGSPVELLQKWVEGELVTDQPYALD